MDDSNNQLSRVLDANNEELGLLLEWQQQQYHQLQSQSLAALGSAFTILAIIGTAVSLGIITIPPPPSGNYIHEASEATMFSRPGIVLIYLFSLMLLAGFFAVTLIMGFHALRRLTNVVTGPQLYPKFQRTIVQHSSQHITKNESPTGVSREFIGAVNKNSKLLKTYRNNFYGGVLRTVFWFFLLGTTFTIYSLIMDVETYYLSAFSLILASPRILNYISANTGSDASLPDRDEPLDKTVMGNIESRFPLKFDSYEKIPVKIIEGAPYLIVITITADLVIQALL